MTFDVENAVRTSKPAVLSHRGRFIEFRARGVSHWRLGKELPDGRIAYLEFDRAFCGVTGEHFARGLRTRHKLEAAVEAARYWQREAEKARGAMREGGWRSADSIVSVGMSLLGSYFVKRGLKQ